MYDDVTARSVALPAAGAATVLYAAAVLASFPPLVSALVLLFPMPWVAIGILSMRTTPTRTRSLALTLVSAAVLFPYGYAFLNYFPSPLGGMAWLAQIPALLGYVAIAWLAGKLRRPNP